MKVLPSVLVRQYQEELIGYIDTSFPITNSISKELLKEMLHAKDAVFYELYVAMRIPFHVYE